MGAKTWILVYSDDARVALAADPELDREATDELVRGMFPKYELERLDEDGDLAFACPRGNELMAGCFANVSILAAEEFGIDYPSKLKLSFLAHDRYSTITLVAMHSVVDWFAFAQWENGTLRRALSVSPDSGVIEDIGAKLEFEGPYWAGQQPAVDDDEESYPLPFHPLEMAEDALKHLFGYQIEGFIDESLLDPESIALARYKRKRSWWKFW